jgi:hypothetical protein
MNSMGQVDDGSFSKQASAALASIAEMYKQAHIADPGGPLASQLQMLMDAVAEAEAEYSGAGAAQPEAAPDQAVPMEGDAQYAQAAPDAMAPADMPTDMSGAAPSPDQLSQMAGPEPTNWDDATAQADQMLAMDSAARKRRG